MRLGVRPIEVHGRQQRRIIRTRHGGQLSLGDHLARERADIGIVIERQKTVYAGDDTGRVFVVSDEGLSRRARVRKTPMERIELLEQRDERVDAANALRAIVVELPSMSGRSELLVNP